MNNLPRLHFVLRAPPDPGTPCVQRPSGRSSPSWYFDELRCRTVRPPRRQHRRGALRAWAKQLKANVMCDSGPCGGGAEQNAPPA